MILLTFVVSDTEGCSKGHVGVSWDAPRFL